MENNLDANNNESNILSDVSKKIDEYLSKNNITPYEMGKNTGVSQVTIGRYRKGTSTPTGKNLEKILNVYPDLLGNDSNYPINVRFLEVYEYLKKAYPDFSAEKINISQEEFDDISKGKIKVPIIKVINIRDKYPEINTDYIIANYGNILNTVIDFDKITDKVPNGNLKNKEYHNKIQVRVVSTKAQAGWSEGYYNDEYLDDLPIITIEADEPHRGNYLAFEVSGDSMEPDYIAGDIVICREIQRHLWQFPLHIKDWDFVIAHATNGIMLKEIIKHDAEKGIIYCHSINPKYEDFKINLKEVRFLYNVVEVRQKGRSKRSNRAKDFF